MFSLNFFLADKATAELAYVTQVILSMCELQDKGKGPYIEISTLLSEYLVIQVQEGIKANVQIVLHALAVVSGNVVLYSLITNCIHVVPVLLV